MFKTLTKTSFALATITALTLGGNFAGITNAEAAGFVPALTTANIVETADKENYIIVAKARGGKSSFKGGRNINRGSRGISRNRVTGRGRNITTRRDVIGKRGGRVTLRNPKFPTVPGSAKLPNVPNIKPTRPGKITIPPGGLVVADPKNPCAYIKCTDRPQPPQKVKKRIKRGVYIQANTRHCHKKIRTHTHVHKHSKRAHIHAQGCKTYRVQP